jgi:uncharacterized RDD family membrane protein YckC
MNRSVSQKKLKTYIAILTLIFLFMQVLVCTDDETLSEDIIPLAIIAVVFLIFVWFTVKGYAWAKWVLSLLLFLYSLAYLFAGISIPSFKFLIAGAYCLLFGLILHYPVLNTLSISKESITKATFDDSFNFPYLIDRYKASLIDSAIITMITIFIIVVINYYQLDSLLSLIFSLIVFMLYEPFLVAFSSTVGQRFMKISVRNINVPDKRITLVQSYLRFVTKISLGIVSFFTINFNSKKRAIHDYVGMSVMIKM